MRLIRLSRVKTQIVQRQRNETGLRVMRIEIHHYKHFIGAVCAALRIGDDLLVVNVMKP